MGKGKVRGLHGPQRLQRDATHDPNLWVGMHSFRSLYGRRPRMRDVKRHELERKLNMSLAELELSVRATNCLESEGITTVRDLVIRTDEELLEVRNFGETTLREVKNKLAERGLQLGMKLPSSIRR